MGDAQRQSLEELSAWASASDPHTGRPRKLQFDILPAVTFVTIAAASLSAQRPRFGEPYTEAEFVTFCSSYPILAGSTGRPVTSQPPLLEEERQSVQVRRAWTLSDSDDPGKFRSRHTRPYLGDDDRYIFPSIGGDQQALHPLLAWWAILFALSMLARYQPDTWTDYLDIDKSPAVSVETLLDRALLTCPELLLHAIRSVSR